MFRIPDWVWWMLGAGGVILLLAVIAFVAFAYMMSKV